MSIPTRKNKFRRLRYGLFSIALCLTAILMLHSQSSLLPQAKDSVVVIAGKQYSGISLFQQLLMGKNYRRSWRQTVRLPVFYFSKSGYTIIELGGGKQTKSLRLRDKNGQIWVLRTVNKDVTPAVPKWLHGSPFHRFKQDLISADHPYGAIIVAGLLQTVRITAPDPVFYFIADEEALGVYRSLFGGTVCMLENYAPTKD